MELYRGTPVGTLCAYMGMIADGPKGAQPLARIEAQGWLLCNGRALEIAKYPQLYGVLGTLYGGSDGHFCLPDCRGHFLRGVDAGSGNDPDCDQRSGPPGISSSGGVGSVQGDAVISHTHPYQSHPSAPGMGNTEAPALQSSIIPKQSGAPNLASSKLSQHETRPLNIAVNYLIRYR